MIPSIAYPELPYASYWGPPTASSDFCEENYVITPYIAEFINTFTNLNYCLFCWHGLATLHKQNRLTLMNALPHIGLLGVGVFSAGFHVTLREWPQLADDMSMVFPTAFIFLRILRFDAVDLKSAKRRTMIFFAILALIYSVHFTINNPHLHSITFGVGVHYIRSKTWKLLSERIKDDHTRQYLERTAMFGAISFAWGFFLWAVDQLACSTLTRGRRAMGIPWSFVLEFHGWWHIFTGIGSYIFIVLVDFLTSDPSEKTEVGQVDFGWPANRMITNVAIVPPVVAHSDGSFEGVNGVSEVNGVNGATGVNGVKKD